MPGRPSVEKRVIAEEVVEAEIARLHAALQDAREELEALRDRAERELGAEEAAIFSAHLLMLEDPELVHRAEQYIRTERCNAEWAQKRAGEEIAAELAAIPDDYLRARADDVRDVSMRVVSLLSGVPRAALSKPDQPAIIVADELLASDIAHFDRSMILGIAMQTGSPTSHAAILARSMGLPAVLGAPGLLDAVRTGDVLVVNGDAGEVIINPDAAELATWEEQRRARDRRRQELQALSALPAATTDGHAVEVAANIGFPADVEPALAAGAEGVGLFRTEFLFLDRAAPPSEEEQFAAYSQVARALAGRKVIIRTLDIGGDKHLPWLAQENEANPFLGLRGARLCLWHQEVFRTQLRALLRASAEGNIWVMFPMISDVKEVLEIRRVVNEVSDQLAAAGVPHRVPTLGIMVEVPSAALTVEAFLDEVDFVSIGTNDLTQYTLAADRTNASVASLADPLHPAVLRLIAHVVEAVRQAGKWVGVCGDLAGDPVAAPVLVGLGVDELSMAASLIPEVKAAVRSLSFADARRLALRAKSCRTAGEVREVLQQVTA